VTDPAERTEVIGGKHWLFSELLVRAAGGVEALDLRRQFHKPDGGHVCPPGSRCARSPELDFYYPNDPPVKWFWHIGAMTG
jgi:hypothetical protein